MCHYISGFGSLDGLYFSGFMRRASWHRTGCSKSRNRQAAYEVRANDSDRMSEGRVTVVESEGLYYGRLIALDQF